jgi:hypothetical protein
MGGGQLNWTMVSKTVAFGNLLDGKHPVWVGDFTGVHRRQILLQYVGDGNWWLADFAA